MPQPEPQHQNPSSLRQTAYAHDARPLPGTLRVECGWADPIGTLIAQGYCFHDAMYEPPGVLFRGVGGGVAVWPEAGDTAPHFEIPWQSEFERQLGVTFCSQDASDALGVSRLWEARDGAVLVLDASVFEREWAARRAAIMAFAEAGVVFRYPFFTRPLCLADIALVIRPAGAGPAARADRELTLPASTWGDRTACEQSLMEILRSRGMAAAALRYRVGYPHP